MSDYTPTGDGWIEGVPADGSEPVEVVSYTVSPGGDSGKAVTVWHRPLPGLPTTPGYYVSAADGTLHVLLGGAWSDGIGQMLTEDLVREASPLERLVTAAEVLEEVRQAITSLGTLDGDAKAAVYTALDGIEDSYGVNG